MTKVSSTYLFHILRGFTAVVMALFSNESIYKLATIGCIADPMAAHLVLVKKMTLEQEVGVPASTDSLELSTFGWYYQSGV